MKKIISIINQKGGVGKTTSTINIGAGLARILKKKVLALDLDPQGNLSSALGLNVEDYHEKNIYHVLTQKHELRDCIYKTGVENLEVCPSDINLSGVEVELANTIARESRLKRSLKTVSADYDYILIDCPPSLGLLTINSLNSSDECLVPMQSEPFAIDGVSQLIMTLELLVEELNAKVKLGGLFFTMIDKRTTIHKEIEQGVKSQIPDLVLDTTISRSIKFAEIASLNTNIFDYAPTTQGANAYLELIKEYFILTEEDLKNIELYKEKIIEEDKNGRK